MSNHVDQFEAAVALIVGHGDVKARLISAFEKHLAIIDSEQLPAPIKKEFTDLRTEMTGVEPLNSEGHTCATVRKMSIGDAEKCAHKMLAIYTSLLCQSNRAKQSVADVNVGSKPRIPPFLIKSAS